MIRITDETTLGELMEAGISVKLDLVANYRSLVERAPEPEPEQSQPEPVTPEPTPEEVMAKVTVTEVKGILQDVAKALGPAKVLEITGPIKSLDGVDLEVVYKKAVEVLNEKSS